MGAEGKAERAGKGATLSGANTASSPAPATTLRDLDSWVRCELRCSFWEQWGWAGYRELRKRGVSAGKAWTTRQFAYGRVAGAKHRLSQSRYPGI